MTNYNERLDEILGQLMSKTADASYGEWQVVGLPEAKQAITSLIKELVVEAKPARKDQMMQSIRDDESRCRFYRYGGYNFAIDQFEQNLLKALEEQL